MAYFDFEKPLEDLEAQLAQLRLIADKNAVDMSDSIVSLEQKIKETRTAIYKNLTGWQRVQIARHPERPYTLDYAKYAFDTFIELHGDRNVGDDKAMVGGFADLDGQTVMLIGHQKGSNTKQRQYRNFGMANPEGYRKALRLMKMAERFGKPVVCLIDTPGAFPGLEAEERGQAEAIARNLFEMTQLRVPIICIIVGEGASGGAIGIGVGDRVLMLENTWYSVISPESCSSILWRSWDFKETAAAALKLSADDMYGNKLVDGIIPEPMGGAHNNPEEMAATIREVLKKELAVLMAQTPDERIDGRIDKFGSMGKYRQLA